MGANLCGLHALELDARQLQIRVKFRCPFHVVMAIYNTQRQTERQRRILTEYDPCSCVAILVNILSSNYFLALHLEFHSSTVVETLVRISNVNYLHVIRFR